MTDSKLVVYGEVLFDCFPDGTRVLGGAPFNVAWHSQAFGLDPLFISRVGNDEMGSEIRSGMLDWGMDSSGLQLDSVHATGIVDVSFEQGQPSYKIIENSAWDFIDQQAVPVINKCSILYHGSLILRNHVSAHCLEKLKQQCTDSIFIDVNLRNPWWDLPQINTIMQDAKWIKINDEELRLIVQLERDIESKARHLLSELGLDLIVVTQGSAGAIAISQKETVLVQPEKNVNVVDTVGAGDAFSSVLILGLLKDWSLDDTLRRAQQFASAVVGQHGATTQDKNFYIPFIEKWSL